MSHPVYGPHCASPSPISGHLGGFYLLAVVNVSATSMGVPLFKPLLSLLNLYLFKKCQDQLLYYVIRICLRFKNTFNNLLSSRELIHRVERHSLDH